MKKKQTHFLCLYLVLLWGATSSAAEGLYYGKQDDSTCGYLTHEDLETLEKKIDKNHQNLEAITENLQVITKHLIARSRAERRQLSCINRCLRSMCGLATNILLLPITLTTVRFISPYLPLSATPQQPTPEPCYYYEEPWDQDSWSNNPPQPEMLALSSN